MPHENRRDPHRDPHRDRSRRDPGGRDPRPDALLPDALRPDALRPEALRPDGRRHIPRPVPRRYRALFLSDIHLGTRGCQSRLLLDFLRHTDADTIYLVGDVVDAWRLKQAWYWPQEHNDVVQKLLRKVRKRVRLVYLPGNHDEFLKAYPGLHFGGVEVAASAVHIGVDGRRYLVVHGDAFDVVVRHARWLALLGDWAYESALSLNAYLNAARRALGLTYWSLSQWAKLKVKGAVNFIGGFEAALVVEARRQGVDGIICGHIHHAAIHDRLGLRYMNCGDWVESCTALVETYEGAFEILRWPRPDDAREDADTADETRDETRDEARDEARDERRDGDLEDAHDVDDGVREDARDRAREDALRAFVGAGIAARDASPAGRGPAGGHPAGGRLAEDRHPAVTAP